MTEANSKNATKQEYTFEQAKRVCEALIFASTVPVTNELLQQKIGDSQAVAPIMEQLLAQYKGGGVELVEIAGGWMFRTAPDLSSQLNITIQVRRKLPRVAAETLAIIAYHQPISRAEIESIRGVATARETLDMLMELGWVRPGKRRETPGRPLTWITSDDFLRHFGLGSLKDLPGVQDLRESGLLDSRPVLAPFGSEDAENAGSVEIEDEDLEYIASQPENESDAETDDELIAQNG
ncbi:MAG: SMC-Scp complex subunit ScpB [Alphaproteobacteria bacterium]|nr:SMC-Scp complex subunit ScpB [Alphaproteobacteria bacterium]